jgi:hypothetical protein
VITRDERGDHYLPTSKILLSVRDGDSRSPEGVSALRPLYYYCEAKKDLLGSDAASCERAARGTLVGIEGPDPSKADRDKFDALAATWQSGGTAWCRLPTGWSVSWDYGGDIPDPSVRTTIYDQAIARVFDDELQSLGQNKYGARAVGEEFRLSTERQLAGMTEELACDTAAQIIAPLCQLNGWDIRRAPILICAEFFSAEKIRMIREFCSGPDPLIALTPDDIRAVRRSLGLR